MDQPKYPFVFVIWIDSQEPYPNADIDFAEIPGTQAIHQAGFLIVDAEEHITIAGAHKPENETYDYVISIPKFAVKTIQYLQLNSVSEKKSSNNDRRRIR